MKTDSCDFFSSVGMFRKNAYLLRLLQVRISTVQTAGYAVARLVEALR
jgi:hypothetical protein